MIERVGTRWRVTGSLSVSHAWLIRSLSIAAVDRCHSSREAGSPAAQISLLLIAQAIGLCYIIATTIRLCCPFFSSSAFLSAGSLSPTLRCNLIVSPSISSTEHFAGAPASRPASDNRPLLTAQAATLPVIPYGPTIATSHAPDGQPRQPPVAVPVASPARH